MLPAEPPRAEPLEVQATSYFAASVNILSFSITSIYTASPLFTLD
jgi:hypothetical protein